MGTSRKLIGAVLALRHAQVGMYRTREGARSSWYADFPKAHDQSLEYRHLITQDGTPLMGRDQYNPLFTCL
ncbi:hypothetical protein V2G26_016067 [Clonostachys chloroleuca]